MFREYSARRQSSSLAYGQYANLNDARSNFAPFRNCDRSLNVEEGSNDIVPSAASRFRVKFPSSRIVCTT